MRACWFFSFFSCVGVRTVSEFGRGTQADREADWGEINEEKDRSQSTVPESQALGGTAHLWGRPLWVTDASEFITSQHTTALAPLHCCSWSFQPFILRDSGVHALMSNWFTVLGDEKEKEKTHTLTCQTVVAHRICDCNLNGSSQMSCHLACVGEYLMRLHHHTPNYLPTYICIHPLKWAVALVWDGKPSCH